MPYPGVSEHLWPQMESCVAQAMEQGHSRETAISICSVAVRHMPGALKGRDPNEPNASDKAKFEAQLERILSRYWGAQRSAIEKYLRQNPTATNIPESVLRDAEAYADLVIWLTNAAQAGVIGVNVLSGLSSVTTGANTQAAAWAAQYAGQLVKGIDETTLDALRQQIQNFINIPGYTLADVMSNLPYDDYRGMLIATTETTAAYAQGQLIMAQELSDSYPDVRIEKRWYTNNDDIVCLICKPLNGKRVEMSESFDDDIDAPPAHPGCRCWIGVTTKIRK